MVLGIVSGVAFTIAVAAAAPHPELAARRWAFPLPAAQESALRESFHEKRGSRVHEAVDIMAPRGTPVYAVEDGRVAKLFISDAGGKTIYQYDPSGRFAYYYAHLDRYAPGLADGKEVKRGETIGYVGSTGNAPPHAPHLHFAIFRLGTKGQWWKGDPIDPYPLLAAARRQTR